MRICSVATFVAAFTFVSLAPAYGDVRLTIGDGQVSLVATGATIREILAEWARVGQTTIVNGDRVTGAPVTLQLTNVSEEQALDVILRSVSGYVAAPRRSNAAANLSRFDRIFVMPTSSPPRAAPAAPPPPQVASPRRPPALSVTPAPVQPVDDDDAGDEEPSPEVVRPAPAPAFNGFPQLPGFPQPDGVGGPAAARPVRGIAPMGVAVPGMIVPSPAPPAQPGVPPSPVPVPDPEDR